MRNYQYMRALWAGFCLAAGIARETMRDRYSYEDAIEAKGQFRR